MSIQWCQAYPQARIVACSGEIEIGAVFPPLGKMQGRNRWTWRLWVNGKSWATDGASRTEQAAQEALMTAWQGFLAAANLTDQSATPAASNAMGIGA